ncbi:hypothetical protein [Pseudomonas sp. TCU-HL1]|uniref:hypothetical protein n=1 Tax=Pseudomonas sp. TCU-HL1 TaxID=1856685 RepID=UPI00083D0856|nr:hypothetical protein [Pseudomonas sp. TCU-HL1]AOE86127.1 hypothetical protein THL1_3579 [Pseudomonas sp. TCU-HL1]
MDIAIQRLNDQGGDVWQVEACGMAVSFKDQASAISFAEKLKERVEAPHCVSEDVLQRWADEHSRMCAE